MKKKLALTLVIAVGQSSAWATELNLSVKSGGSSEIVVLAGQVVPFEITAVLSDTDNGGLAAFSFDIEFDGGDVPPVAHHANVATFVARHHPSGVGTLACTC